MKRRKKILIIKTGYSEFLEGEKDSRVVSYGDILRTTSLLHLYKNDHVTWVTDREAFPLLEKNPYIDKLLGYDFITVEQLKEERFDKLINLEKVPGICALTKKIDAWDKYGFRFDPETGSAKAYNEADEVLAVSADPKIKKANNKLFDELLFEMVGQKWNGEKYMLGYSPKSKEICDVGLNVRVGRKWPTKAWPKEYWDNLEKRLQESGFEVTRQDTQTENVLTNLNKYMDWINSSRMIVSCDSLGVHLALALNKKTLGLFGPTPSKEVHFYGLGKAILPKPIPECLPCFRGICERGKNCMKDISPEKVYEEIKRYLK